MRPLINPTSFANFLENNFPKRPVSYGFVWCHNISMLHFFLEASATAFCIDKFLMFILSFISLLFSRSKFCTNLQPYQTSIMQLLAKIVNGFWLTVFAEKHYHTDV